MAQFSITASPERYCLELNKYARPVKGYHAVRTGMKDGRSRALQFGAKLYLMDGFAYLVFDGATVKPVTEDAYVRTIIISRKPTGGGTMGAGVAKGSLTMIREKRISHAMSMPSPAESEANKTPLLLHRKFEIASSRPRPMRNTG